MAVERREVREPPAPVAGAGDAEGGDGTPAGGVIFHDDWVYRLAVGGVSLALVAFFIGGAIVGASGHVKEMVSEYWMIGAALSGALVGILAPSPRQKREAAVKQHESQVATAAAPVAQPILLIVTLVVSLWLATDVVGGADAALLRTLAAASAGTLAGLLAPSPGSQIKA